MIKKETELTVRLQHSCHFHHCLIHLINVLKHQTRNDCIKGLIIGRNLRSAAKKITRPATPFYRYINMQLSRINSENVRALCSKRTSYLTIATAKVKDFVATS